MSESGLSSIGVIGIGVMGNGIAQVTAQSGFTTVVMDVNEELLKKGLETIGRSLDRLVSAYEKSGGEKGINAAAKEQAVARLSITTSLEGLLGCDLVIEAVPERPELKEQTIAVDAHFQTSVPGIYAAGEALPGLPASAPAGHTG